MPVSGEFSQRVWEVGGEQSWGETFEPSTGSSIDGFCSMKVILTQGMGIQWVGIKDELL